MQNKMHIPHTVNVNHNNKQKSLHQLQLSDFFLLLLTFLWAAHVFKPNYVWQGWRESALLYVSPEFIMGVYVPINYFG